MIIRIASLSLIGLLAACLLQYVHWGVEQARAAGESVYQVQLIWGTDGEKPKDKPLKEVDPKFKEKLKGIFKWKNYYEVNRQSLALPNNGSQKLKLSDKCEIQLQDLGNSRIEIRLFCEGKPVVKKGQTVVPGEPIVLAGDGKDDTAWFVVLVRPK